MTTMPTKRRHRTKQRLLAAMTALALLLAGCAGQQEEGAEGVDPEATDSRTAYRVVPKAEVLDINSMPLEEDVTVYKDDDPTSVVTFYATIRRGNRADGTDNSFADVNSAIMLQEMAIEKPPSAEIILQEGDEFGPLPGKLGYGLTQPNGTIRMRGRTSTLARQKSYRIDLLDNGTLWRGQKAIALLKHPNDPSRLRNKLYFDLLKDIPHLTSLRTQFVHLYIKDETSDPPAQEFVDHGLYTFIETPNRRFLRNHGLSREGNLYKANMFEFYRYPDAIRLVTDPEFDQSAFDMVLESKNGTDHSKLIEMLDALNDYTIAIEDIVQKYFDINNLVSFLAYNMLVANTDYNSQNFLIYSPINSDTWYMIPWDGDGSFHYAWEGIRGTQGSAEWQRGVSNVWGTVLFNRVLRVEAYRDLFLERVEELREIITPERIESMIAEYRTVVDTFTHRMPDIAYLPGELEQMEALYEQMPNEPQLGYEYILSSMQKPMPFFLADVIEEEEGVLHFAWGEAYDFYGHLVHYDIQVATDWTFEPDTIVFEATNLLSLEADMPFPRRGEYWWRVVARNAAGETQTAFDTHITTEGLRIGMREFHVLDDGTVVNF